MSEGQFLRLVASSVQHRQEAEVAAAEKRERAAAETAATAARLAMAELAAARAEVEAAAAADAARAAAAAELKALRASSTGSSVSADDDRDNELKLVREAAREQVAQWAAVHPQGRCGSSPDERGRAGGWFDGDRGLYRRRDSPSLDRYHGHHGIQTIVKDVGPGGGWPTLTKTNYVEWPR
jgi:multidrug efflux pump subunit AcrA (membrane-fusion protein)